MKAFWFGSPDRPLFGRFYVPSTGSARAAIVLCPPFGTEATCAARTFQVLGERLADDGFAVLSFDYDGTNDSCGSGQDPHRVAAWRDSVRSAAELIRSSGARKAGAVGMRLGATLLATVAQECRFDAVVLWDPCESGRAYLREQRALRAMHLAHRGIDTDGERPQATAVNGRAGSDLASGTEILGEWYPADTVEEMSGLSIPEGDLAPRALVLTRPERRLPESTVERLSRAHVDWDDAVGQPELVGVQPGMAQVPDRTLGTVNTWLSSVFGDDALPFTAPECPVAVVESGNDERIAEEIVRIGPHQLFGILTRPEPPRSEVVAVILNAGTVDHVGPGRLWVGLARCLARAGLDVLRVDLSGLGDSPARPEQEPAVMYPPEAFDDLEEIQRYVSAAGSRELVWVGLCSGGYHAIEGGLALGTKGVCLLNPVIPRNPLDQPDRRLSPRPADPRRQGTAARRPWVKKLPAHDRLVVWADRLPGAAWWLFDRIGVELPPARALEKLVNGGVDCFVVCGTREGRVITRGEGSVLRRLRRTGRFQLEVIPGIDHELFERSARETVQPMLTSYLVDRFSSDGARPGN